METKETKITLGLTIGWILGVLAAIAGIGMLFTEPVPGILFILLALVVLPPANRIVKEKFNISLSGGMKVVLVIIIIGVAGANMDTETVPESNSIVTDTAPEVLESEDGLVNTTNKTEVVTRESVDTLKTES